MRKALVYLWTGPGAGKTTSALGVALRAVGQGKRVVIVQFMKGRKDIGEYKIARKLRPLYKIKQFGRPVFLDPTGLHAQKPKPIDYELARKGLDWARKILVDEKPYLLVLDEINLAAAWGLVDKAKVLALLDKAPPECTIYLTGRLAPKEFIARADYVNEVRMIKQPVEKVIPARKGIEF